ncbi:TetR/AcrR family transcriptional regulator [Rhodococcoides trifolii]|nr:TetR/AcrR family transcriptional regulator [Rhodococcus trifolii]
MTSIGAGRPRLGARKRPGATARDEILDAAAELFTTQGFTSTSTRAIADAVGIRQASLYHHFGTKDDILAALLVGTVDAPLAHARELRGLTEDAVLRLYTLAWFDAGQLAHSRWNLGALYFLPELANERFEPFRAQRTDLMAFYTEFSRAAVVAIGALDPADTATAALPFRLVESVINTRSDFGEPAGRTAVTIADAAIRALGWTGPPGEFEGPARALLNSTDR